MPQQGRAGGDTATGDASPPPPYRCRRLPVGGGHILYIEECGNPSGIPVVFLHGGPGSGCTPRQRLLIDTQRFRAIFFDQRGCGRSTPAGRCHANTLRHTVADLESIRRALGIERWLILAGSWGALPALAYLRRHRRRVIGLVLRGAFLGTPAELGAYLARHPAPLAATLRRPPRRRRPEALALAAIAAMHAAPIATALRIGRRWSSIEQHLLTGSTLPSPAQHPPLRQRIRIHTHLLRLQSQQPPPLPRSPQKAAPPIHLIHGSADPICPPGNTARIHRCWPDARITLIPGAGHSAFAPEIRAAVHAALAELAERPGLGADNPLL